MFELNGKGMTFEQVQKECLERFWKAPREQKKAMYKFFELTFSTYYSLCEEIDKNISEEDFMYFHDK